MFNTKFDIYLNMLKLKSPLRTSATSMAYTINCTLVPTVYDVYCTSHNNIHMAYTSRCSLYLVHYNVRHIITYTSRCSLYLVHYNVCHIITYTSRCSLYHFAHYNYKSSLHLSILDYINNIAHKYYEWI